MTKEDIELFLVVLAARITPVPTALALFVLLVVYGFYTGVLP